MASIDERYAFRDAVVEELVKDLVGPAEGPSETISEAPLDRYIAGVLWPADDLLQESGEPDSGEAEENDTDDSPISQALMRYPTSMGITFSVDLTKAMSCEISVAAAKYVPSGARGGDRGGDGGNSWRQRIARPDSWAREQQAITPISWNVS
jgi:hypothetical protein